MASETILKQVIVLRTDLTLSAGKAAAQAAHAAVNATNRADADVREAWFENQHTKIVLGVPNEAELRSIAEQARANGLPTSVISDAGRTEIESGTTTALAIGPAEVDALDDLTGHLSLY